MDKGNRLSIYGQGNCSLSLHWEFLNIFIGNGLSENDLFFFFFLVRAYSHGKFELMEDSIYVVPKMYQGCDVPSILFTFEAR